jgi:hypothetical protein
MDELLGPGGNVTVKKDVFGCQINKDVYNLFWRGVEEARPCTWAGRVAQAVEHPT